MRVASDAEIRDLEERLDYHGLRGLWIMFHDYSSRACAKWIPRPWIPSALRTGGVFARANLNFTIDDQQVPEPRFGADTGDFFAVPDPGTFTPIPYRPSAARVLSFMTTEEGALWEGCPRGRLTGALDALAERGLIARVAFEPEFTLFQRTGNDDYAPADRFAMYSTDRMDAHYELLARIESALTDQQVRVVQIGSEAGAGQVEVNLHHESPLKAADDLLTLRETARALARDAGLIATFMPKPYDHLLGNGLHVHLSLWDQDGSENRSVGDRLSGISTEMRHFIGGVLTHALAICGVAAPTVNSYKRLQPATWAPAHVAWATGNRSALVRIPGSTRTRMEFRAGDHTANPYLLLTALLAAGVDGLREQTDPGEPSQTDLGTADPKALAERGIEFLPRSTGEALNAIEADAVVMDALGPVCGPELLRVKRYELARYERQVSDWERELYMERV